MTTCEHCNGVGYTAIVNGDNDIPCKVCEGTDTIKEQGNMKTIDISAHWYSKDFSQYVYILNVESYTTTDDGLIVRMKKPISNGIFSLSLPHEVVIITDTEDAANFIIQHTECRQWVKNYDN